MDIQNVFELPPDTPKTYEARSPWRQDRQQPSITLTANAPYTFHPVSYTHLDVYKRQRPSSASARCPTHSRSSQISGCSHHFNLSSREVKDLLFARVT